MHAEATSTCENYQPVEKLHRSGPKLVCIFDICSINSKLEYDILIATRYFIPHFTSILWAPRRCVPVLYAPDAEWVTGVMKRVANLSDGVHRLSLTTLVPRGNPNHATCWQALCTFLRTSRCLQELCRGMNPTAMKVHGAPRKEPVQVNVIMLNCTSLTYAQIRKLT